MARWLIPSSWEWVAAGDIAEIIGGGTPPSKNPANFATDGIPWLTPADLSGYEKVYIERGARSLSSSGFAACGARMMPKGTVLYTSRAPIGYCVIAANEICTNQGFKSFALFSDTSPEYVRYYLLASKEYAESLASGSTFLELSGKRLSELAVPLAPAAEQRRIADKITVLDTHARAARKHLDAIPPLLEKFRASILTAAFSGRLTADWREEQKRKGIKIESAETLLQRMRQERRQRWEQEQLARMQARKRPPKDDSWKNKYKEPEPIDTSKLPKLPDGWCWASIDTFAFVTKLAGFEYTKYVKYSADGDLAVIKAENAGKHGFRRTDFSFVKSDSVKMLERSKLIAGDLLMVFVGAGVGQVGRVPDDQPYFLGPNIGMIRVMSDFVHSGYCEYFLRSPVGFKLSMSFTKAVAQPSLSMGAIRQIPTAIPPLAEQIEIEKRIHNMMSLTDKIETSRDCGNAELFKLNEAILAKAFRGELVPQDPNDEPATELLKRIAEEKANRQATGIEKR